MYSRLLICAAMVLLYPLHAAEVRVEVASPKTAAWLASLTAYQRAQLEKLNHADLDHLPRLPALVVPANWNAGQLKDSPFPALWPSAQAQPKALIVDLTAQVFAAYSSGKLVNWGPVSTGAAASPTEPGFYHLNWRSRSRRSTVNADWLMTWYFNFSNREGNALHAYSMPGLPASHGCIRLLERDAEWLYNWGEGWTLDEADRVKAPGTPLLITGQYHYDQAPPWRTASWWARPMDLPPLPQANGVPAPLPASNTSDSLTCTN